jgi:hypothetical protein
MITHKEYMANSTELHHAYYLQFATEDTKRFVLEHIGMDKLLRSACPHLNDIVKHSNGGTGSWVWDYSPYNVTLMREAGEVSKGTCLAHLHAHVLVRLSLKSLFVNTTRNIVEVCMYQAIQVKYLGPTNYLGSRYKATAAAGSVTIGADDALTSVGNHVAAANALCDKFGWPKYMVHGQLADGSYAFVMISK